jgi:hypothetical protein
MVLLWSAWDRQPVDGNCHDTTCDAGFDQAVVYPEDSANEGAGQDARAI